MASIGPRLNIVSLQSVMPTRVTEPGRSRRLILSYPLRSEALQSRLRLVLYYKRTCEEDSARTVAAWIKESLSVALSEQPVLAGRFRRNGEGGGENWEVKFNDSGVRLVEATAETTMEDVLGSKDRDGWEARLGYWQDVDAENPNFSALFFVQVTEFKGDGYSIGISCSLLLADPLFLTKFLREWALVHNLMLAQGKLSRTPIFHLGYFVSSRRHTQIEPDTSSSAAATTTVLFKVVEPPVPAENIVRYEALLNHCIEEASKRFDGRAMQDWSLLVSDHSGDVELKSFAKAPPSMSFDGTVNVSRWDEFGLKEMALSEGNKPIHVSYRVVSTAEQGLVVAMRSSSVEEGDFGLLISVTVPTKTYWL